MYGPEEDAALSVDIGKVFLFQRGLKREGRPEGDGPAKGVVGGLVVDVLLNGDACVDARAVDFAALFVEAAHRRTHAFGAHGDDVDVRRKCGADGFQVPKQEPVRKAQSGARFEGIENAFVVLGLRGVGDEKQDQVGFGDDRVHFAERAVFFGETGCPGFVHRGGALSQAHFDCDRGALKGFPEVQRLRGALRAPADDTDLPDAFEGLRQLVKKVATAADDKFLGA